MPAPTPATMPEFTLDEVQALRAGIDTMIRSEGSGLAQTGISGLAQGRAELLSARFAHALTAMDKLDALVKLLTSSSTPGNEG